MAASTSSLSKSEVAMQPVGWLRTRKASLVAQNRARAAPVAAQVARKAAAAELEEATT